MGNRYTMTRSERNKILTRKKNYITNNNKNNNKKKNVQIRAVQCTRTNNAATRRKNQGTHNDMRVMSRRDVTCAAENEEEASSSPTTTTTTAVKDEGEMMKEKKTPTTKKKGAVIAGMDTSRGIFGFNPFSELWVGRWAMIGFASGLSVELVTGKGILRQVGIETPSTPVLVGLSAFIGGATLLGSGITVARLMTGKMTDEEIADYAFFLGLKGERSATKKSSAAMKQKGDFTSLQEMDEVDDAANAMKAKGQAAGTDVEPALLPEEEDIDSYLARSEMAEAAYAKGVELNNGRYARRQCSHSHVLASLDFTHTHMCWFFSIAHVCIVQVTRRTHMDACECLFAYGNVTPSLSVSLSLYKCISLSLSLCVCVCVCVRACIFVHHQSRWAMVGFAAAILVEAATGNSVGAQLISYGKATGLLGDMSGF